ncbi:uncharacterized protein [Amphiura filiformis]|uniref:uncharacterized protein n=1 Tax=Amphiura filiformis TaxID=82378 RepID=UPI003B20DB27
MPRYIKVLTSIRRKPTEVQLEAGDILEVLGTTRRLTKVGVVEFLRLQKKHREFVLHPDFEGNFEVLEDKTQYTLTEILDRFPLPQQVCISKPEQHCDTLLNKLPAKEHDDDVKLTLKREYQKEYVIGVDMYGRVGVVVDMDADVQFFLPNASRNHSNTCTGEHDIIHRILTKSTQSNGELRMDQVICQKEEKLVLCKPWQQLFKDSPPVLPFRRPSGEISTVSVSSGSNIADDATTNSDDSHYRSVTYDSVTDSDSGHDTLDEEPTISTGKIYEGHKNLMDGQVRNINHMNESTLSKNEPGHDRRNTLQKRRNKIITSPYVNIAIVPPERKPTHAPVPSLTLDRTHNRALYDDHPCSSNTTQEQYAPFSTSLPNRSHFLEDEDIMYQNCVPNTTTSIVYQNSVQDGIRPPFTLQTKTTS